MKNNWRQHLHLEPETGWLNDPNGLCYFQGNYHVYFQYSPGSALGETPRCWGHFQSPDLLRWEFTGIALHPDLAKDQNGVYSGCGFVKEGRLFLFYTGNVKHKGDFDYITAGREANVILAVAKDAAHPGEKQVLLENRDYPLFCSCHVRDPKVFETDGSYQMVLGARKLDDTGCVLLYSSKDLIRWQYERELSIPHFGYMWECPDLISLEGKRFLGISPQGLPHSEFRHQNVYSSGYFGMHADGSLDTDPENPGSGFEEWDYGFDFYAPQTFDAPDGRKLLIGWMGIGDIPYSNPTVEYGWQHCLTLPRELSLGPDQKIRQSPLRELEGLRRNPRFLTEETAMTVSLPFEIHGHFSGSQKDGFCLAMNGSWDIQGQDGICTFRFLDLKVSGGRSHRHAALGTFRDIRVIVDTSSIEIYLNDGEKVMSSRFYPNGLSAQISVRNLSGMIYDLEEMEVTYLA